MSPLGRRPQLSHFSRRTRAKYGLLTSQTGTSPETIPWRSWMASRSGLTSPDMDRAYSFLTVKKFDDDARTISGTASTPELDRAGDSVSPLGAKFRLPLPL